MSFPDPNSSTTHTIGSKTWNWDGEKWVLESSTVELPDFEANTPILVTSSPESVAYGYDPTAVDEELTLS